MTKSDPFGKGTSNKPEILALSLELTKGAQVLALEHYS